MEKKAPSKGSTNVRPLRRPTSALLLASSRSQDARPVRRVDSRTRKHQRLERDVQVLRLEIARLQQLRQLLEQQALNRADNHAGSACRVVKQYFEVFRRGYVPPRPDPLMQKPQDTSVVDPDSFLNSVMDEDVVGGGFRGVDIMIEQWKRYDSAFVGTKIQFVRAEVTSVDVDPESGKPARIHVTAAANYAGHLTLAGVEGMFPHILANPELVVGLIGQVIGGLGSYHFVFDCETQRVVENLINIDLVGAFAKVVPKATDLGLLFGQALVTSQYYMGDDSDEKAQSLRGCESPSTTTSTLTSDEEELTGKQMSLGRILCEDDTDSII